eukprot:gene10310-biopygen1755
MRQPVPHPAVRWGWFFYRAFGHMHPGVLDKKSARQMRGSAPGSLAAWTCGPYRPYSPCGPGDPGGGINYTAVPSKDHPPPSNLAWRSDLGGPEELARVTCGVMESTCGVMASTCGLMASTCGGMASTCGVMASTCGVMGSPCGVMGSTCGVMGSTCGVMGSTCGVMGSTCGVMGSPCG